ncbi:MAG: hypothetical protein ACKVQS_02290 [Fimbriimonadaceae bacterium]
MLAQTNATRYYQYMMQINFFDFYKSVALDYQKQVLGISTFTPELIAQYRDTQVDLGAKYFKNASIDYSDPITRIAYTLHYAPKHATVWRELAKSFSWKKAVPREWSLNSIGPGPGSDIFGMLSAIPKLDGVQISVFGLEEEEGWREIYEIARDKFIELSGRPFESIMTNNLVNLNRSGQIIGSFVLTDAARNNSAKLLLQGLSNFSNSPNAMFLDFSSYLCPVTGESIYISNLINEVCRNCKWDYLPETHSSLGDALRQDVDSSSGLIGVVPKFEVPKCSLFKVKLK